MSDSVANRNVVLVGALFVVGALVVYAPALDGGFVWDDDAHVTKPELRNAAGLVRMWVDPSATQQYYPLTHSGFWLQSWAFGEDPVGYHVVNVLLHALSAVLVWLTLRRLLVPGALLAAAIFLVHPVHVESVAWISELKNSLSGVFYLAAALAYLRYAPPEAPAGEPRDLRGWTLAFVLFVCALASKTVTATLPVALLLIYWWKRGRLSWRRDVVPWVPFLVVGVGAGLTTAWIEWTVIGARGTDYAFSVVERTLIAGRVFWFYLAKLLWPFDLIFIYPRWTIDSGAWWQYLYPLAALALVGTAWALRGRIGRGPVTGLLFFAGTLFPVLGFVNVYPFKFSFVADHFQYLASLGIITLVSAGFVLGLRQLHTRGLPVARLGGALGVLLLAALGWLSWQQAHIYEDAETLWVDTSRRNPGSFMAHNNLGYEYSRQGRYDEAQRAYETAIEIKPDFDQAYFNIGRLHGKLGRHEQAIEMYESAIALRPSYADAYYNLGIERGALGQHREAMLAFSDAVEARPDFAEAHFNLGSAYGRLGMYPEAVKAFESAIALQPDYHEAQFNLGVAYRGMGRTREAIERYRSVIESRPEYAEAYGNLGVAHGDPDPPACRW